eukprot:1852674-Prymnesium_polylepis.1
MAASSSTTSTTTATTRNNDEGDPTRGRNERASTIAYRPVVCQCKDGGMCHRIARHRSELCDTCRNGCTCDCEGCRRHYTISDTEDEDKCWWSSPNAGGRWEWEDGADEQREGGGRRDRNRTIDLSGTCYKTNLKRKRAAMGCMQRGQMQTNACNGTGHTTMVPREVGEGMSG